MKEHLPLVEVEWEDSGFTEAWVDEDTHMENLKPLMCRSVGWLTLETKGMVVLVAGRTSTSQSSGWTQIPRGCIRSIRYVER